MSLIPIKALDLFGTRPYIDLKGSMSGNRIEMAKKALVLFSKSLPVNSKFNIISFGSTAAFLYKISIGYTSQNINETIEKVVS